MKELLKEYQKKKDVIKRRLEEFRKNLRKSDNVLFEELCFCLLTPQSKALTCDRALKNVVKRGLLFRGKEEDIRRELTGVRFPNNKARFVVEARRSLVKGSSVSLRSRIDERDIEKTREWLVKNVKGMGYKEASHFLRNIGLGRDIAILDRHILKNLKKLGVIKKIPRSITRKRYLDIERKMRVYFARKGIRMDEADLLFWSRETGVIFK